MNACVHTRAARTQFITRGHELLLRSCAIASFFALGRDTLHRTIFAREWNWISHSSSDSCFQNLWSTTWCIHIIELDTLVEQLVIADATASEVRNTPDAWMLVGRTCQNNACTYMKILWDTLAIWLSQQVRIPSRSLNEALCCSCSSNVTSVRTRPGRLKACHRRHYINWS